MAKPTTFPDFATEATGNNIATPDSTHQTNGFINEFVPRQWLNFLFKHIGSWVHYLDGLTGTDVQSGNDDGFTIAQALEWLEKRGEGLRYGYGCELSCDTSRYFSVTEGRIPVSYGAHSFDAYAASIRSGTKDVRTTWQIGGAGQGAVPSTIFPINSECLLHVFVLRNSETGATDFAVDTNGSGSNIAADSVITAAGFNQRRFIGLIAVYMNSSTLTTRQINQNGDTTFTSYPIVTVEYTNSAFTFKPYASSSLAALYSNTILFPERKIVELEVSLSTQQTNSVTFMGYEYAGSVTVSPGETKIFRLPVYNGSMYVSSAGASGTFNVRLLSYSKLARSSYVS